MMTRMAWVCAAVLAGVGVGGVGWRAGDEGAPLRVVMLSGSEEYESDRTLEAFRGWLEARYPVRRARPGRAGKVLAYQQPHRHGGAHGYAVAGGRQPELVGQRGGGEQQQQGEKL